MKFTFCVGARMRNPRWLRSIEHDTTFFTGKMPIRFGFYRDCVRDKFAVGNPRALPPSPGTPGEGWGEGINRIDHQPALAPHTNRL
jgi:hypothetical protein